MNAYYKLLGVAIAVMIALLAALIQPRVVQADACTPFTASELCVNAPAGAPGDQCQQLATYLVEFQQTACGIGLPDPDYYPNYAAILTYASGNRGPDLLGQWSMQNIEVELDRLTEMGVNSVGINIGYPLLTPAFHTYLHSVNSSYTWTVDDYIDFYVQVIAKARARGLKVHIEQGVMLRDFASVNPHPYFDMIRALEPTAARQRYWQEMAQESYLIVTELAPDSLSLVGEPETANEAIGLIQGEPLATPTQWRDYVDYAISLLPAHSTRLGAGAGAWEAEELIQLFAAMPALDFIDVHVFPARSLATDYFTTVLERADLVNSIDPGKTIVLGQAWLYKAAADELGWVGVISPEVLSRDVFSYWQPLDSKFIELFSRVSRAKQFETYIPWGAWYFFSYLDYSQAAGMTPAERNIANQVAAYNAMLNGTMTGTGNTYEEIATANNILVVTGVSPNHGPQTGPGATQNVTISGKNFLPGSNTVVKFAGVAATNVVVVDANTITATSPAGVGVVGITVESPDGRSRTKPDAYTYDVPPVISQITPNSGKETGGTFVRIDGQNFVLGSTNTEVRFGGIPATQITVYATAITAYAPAGVGLGTVDVTVTNPDQQSAVRVGGYTFVPPPTVLSVSPNTGTSNGGTLVTITGRGFFPGIAGTRVAIGQLEATNVNVISDTQIRAVTPMGNGTGKVLVMNPDYQTGQLLNAYTFVYPPTIVQGIPTVGPLAGGNTVWLGGYGFQQGTTVRFGSTPATIQSITANLITLTAPPGSGQVQIRVTNPDGQQGSTPYTYSATPPPVIVLLSPTHGPASGGTRVYIYGQNFVPGSTNTTVKFGTQLATSRQVLTPNWIQADAPPGTGSVRVTVTNPDGQSVVSTGSYLYE
ncbi:MAG: IPT/TIG domain-containing protein [Anaerolineae bacterium]|nr:IPT/TIG domain-containing protein [Anaerolineae bacterium]MCO5246156.1 IPT/TIG domain-containing protein [Anaerolineae bacterium]